MRRPRWKTTIIIGSKAGQLGNRLFLFAHFIAFAEEYQIKIINPTFDEYASLFEATKRDLFCCYPPHRSLIRKRALRAFLYRMTLRVAHEIKRFSFLQKYIGVIELEEDEAVMLDSESFLKFVRDHQVMICRGWLFRTEVNFIKHEDKIRAHFRIAAQHEKNVEGLIRQITARCDILVGVHIRRGDYATFQGGKYFYSVEKYADLMRATEKLFPNKKVVFLICSDERLDQQQFEGLDVEFGSGHLVEDMYSLARCNYLIGPPSTFSMWASFYGKSPLYTITDAARIPSLQDFL